MSPLKGVLEMFGSTLSINETNMDLSDTAKPCMFHTRIG
jgi:hypothetical protein